MFEYIDRGTEDEAGLKRLRTAFDTAIIAPSLFATAEEDTSRPWSFLGHERPSPFAIAPTALAGLVAYRGEIALVRAAGRVGLPLTVSTQSVSTIERIRDGAPDTELWFQLYVWRDRTLTEALLRRALGCGVEILVLTADTPKGPKREYNRTNGFGLPVRPSLRAAIDVMRSPIWLARVMVPTLLRDGIPSYGHYPADLRPSLTHAVDDIRVALDPGLGWADVSRLRDAWPGRLVLKGVLRPEDAVRAASLGVDAIVVSAHGGRNFDSAPAPLHVLPEIAAALPTGFEILADSGVRRGSDVSKLLRAGARGVLLGRLPLWGLAVGEEQGAVDALLMILEEFRDTTIFGGVG